MPPASGVRHNLGIKLLSVALALFLWSFVHGSKVVERRLSVPIEYINLADSLLFFEPPPKALQVLVSGPAQELFLRLRFMRDIGALIDLSGARPPQHRIAPSIAQITVPSNARFSFVRVLEPSIVDLRLARRSQRSMPVYVSMRGQVPEGFCLTGEPTAEPAYVTCTGPDFLVDDLEAVPTLPVEYRRERQAFSEKVRLVFDRAHITCVPSEVSVRVPMARLKNRDLGRIALTILPPAAGDLQIAPDAQFASIVVAGPELRIDELRLEDVQLVLDATQLQAGRYDSLAVVAHVPDWIQVVRVQPAIIGAMVGDGVLNLDANLPLDPANPNGTHSGMQ